MLFILELACLVQSPVYTFQERRTAVREHFSHLPTFSVIKALLETVRNLKKVFQALSHIL